MLWCAKCSAFRQPEIIGYDDAPGAEGNCILIAWECPECGQEWEGDVLCGDEMRLITHSGWTSGGEIEPIEPTHSPDGAGDYKDEFPF